MDRSSDYERGFNDGLVTAYVDSKQTLKDQARKGPINHKTLQNILGYFDDMIDNFCGIDSGGE